MILHFSPLRCYLLLTPVLPVAVNKQAMPVNTPECPPLRILRRGNF